MSDTAPELTSASPEDTLPNKRSRRPRANSPEATTAHTDDPIASVLPPKRTVNHRMTAFQTTFTVYDEQGNLIDEKVVTDAVHQFTVEGFVEAFAKRAEIRERLRNGEVIDTPGMKG